MFNILVSYSYNDNFNNKFNKKVTSNKSKLFYKKSLSRKDKYGIISNKNCFENKVFSKGRLIINDNNSYLFKNNFKDNYLSKSNFININMDNNRINDYDIGNYNSVMFLDYGLLLGGESIF